MNGRSIAACALALAFLALSGKAALAQERGQHRGQGRPDTTRGQPDTTREGANGANSEGGHVTSDADRQIIQNDLDRQARQAELDRQAAQGRPSSDQDRQTAERNRQAAERDRQAGDRDRQAADRDRQAADRDRQAVQGGRSFNDNDRQVTRQWYQQNRTRLGAGWRDEDRLSPSMQARLRAGQRLDPELRTHIYWLPPELSARYGPAPRGYRYAVIGGNIVMLDDAYDVHDVFSLDVQIGGQGWNGQQDGRNQRWNGQQDGQYRDDWNYRRDDGFSDQDRQFTRDWYQQNRGRLGPGWRQRDRLSPAMEGRLRRGQRLDPRLRRQMYWLPPELSRRYGPAPRGFRYAIIGGNVVMLDPTYTVWDVFRLDVQIR